MDRYWYVQWISRGMSDRKRHFSAQHSRRCQRARQQCLSSLGTALSSKVSFKNAKFIRQKCFKKSKKSQSSNGFNFAWWRAGCQRRSQLSIG